MPKDPLEIICATFMKSASQKERTFWKPDVLYSVVSILYYRFEQLLDCYLDKPDVLNALLSRVRVIHNEYMDMKSSAMARMQLIEDMQQAHILLQGRILVGILSKASVGDTSRVSQDLNLSFLDLKSQKTAIKKLTGICLSHFEERIAEQLAEKQAAEVSQTHFSPSHSGV